MQSPDEQITSINAELVQARQELAQDTAALQAQQLRIQDWINNTPSHGTSASAQAAIADANHYVIQYTNEVAADNSRIKELEAQLKSATDAKAATDKAYAQAASEGLTGEAANTRALALVQQSKAKSVLLYIGAGALALLVGFFIWWKYLRKK
jgi:chromosome segregation ATPase